MNNEVPNQQAAQDAQRPSDSVVKRLVSFLRKELKWLGVRVPFFALLMLMFYVVSPTEVLSAWQICGATLIVTIARDYLNWVEKKYGS